MSQVLRSAFEPVADPSLTGEETLAELRSAELVSLPSARLSSADSQRAYRQPRWAVRYRIALLTLDLLCMISATVIAYELRFGFESGAAKTFSYLSVGALLCVGWLIAVQNAGGYEVRHLATGPVEAKRMLRASAITVGALAIVCYATKIQLARGFVVGVIPIGVVLLLLERQAVRRYVRARRLHRDWVHRILVVGTSESARHLLEVTEREAGAGLRVAAVCVDDIPVGASLAPGIPVVGGLGDAAMAAERIDADVIAVTSSGLGPVQVRELGWQLEGTGRDLVIAPALTEIAGPRVHVSPVAGLPLVWLEQPQLGRLPRLLKRSLDLFGGVLLFLVAVPIYLVTALAIKLTSRGPVLYKQVRLGLNGAEFTMLKFRSMYRDADKARAAIYDQNEQDGGGVLFKMRADPRVTPVGRLIRKLSIDELPQLVHVLSGRMSLVGPRPLAAADSTYTGSARRRLLVRPGLTGLWQVSGRSDLSWDDSVRLDLYYVENWSLGLDLTILARTVYTVLTHKGAY